MLNRQIERTDALNGTDLLNHTSRIGYDKVGNILTTTDELGRTTSYGYDHWNRLIKTTDALGYSNSRSYDNAGNILTTTDELGRITSYGYDANNRRIKTTDTKGKQRTISYDAVGNLASKTDELDRTTSYTYDLINQLTGVTDALGHTVSNAYDGAGNLIQVTDALGQKTKYTYDELNRQVKTTDASQQKTITGYDARGNILAITDSVGNTTSYTYDALSRQLTDTNSLGKTRSYGYDAVGDLIQSIDRNGRKRTYSYDVLNRQTAEHWLDSLGNDVRTFGYNYDAVGHLLEVSSQESGVRSSKYTYSYDAVDRITGVDNLGTVGVPNVFLNYTYDAVGNLLSTTDRINGVLKGTNSYTYDVLNRATRLVQSGAGVSGKRVEMTYDAASQMTGLSRYGDVAGLSTVVDTSYSFDKVGRLTSLVHKRGGSTVASYGLTYDAGNRITRSSGTDGAQDYSYDATNQLTGVDHTTQVDEAYSYDANGNRTNGGYGTGTNNRLLTDGVYNYSYDDEGNRTSRVEIATGKVTEYVWDYRNRLTIVVFKDAGGAVLKTIEYVYDVDDRRIGKKVDGVTTERYVYDGSDIALVFDGAGNQTHRYLYGTGVDQVLADETATGVVWALGDNQGTVRDVVDGGGVILNHVNYDSFGRVVSQTSSGVEFRFGYTGREQDNETGFDYYRARYYDAGVGRFISEDPLGFAAGDGNIYRYVGNSPTNGTDPFGLFDWGELQEKLKSVAGTQSVNLLGNIFTRSNYYNFYLPLTSTYSQWNVVPIPPPTVKVAGWRSWLKQAFPGSTEHATKFMDYYFDSRYENAATKPAFDLEKEGILESIKSIPKMKKAANDFESLMKNKISQQVSKFKEKSKCTPCTPEYITLSMNAKLHGNNLNLTWDGNFSLGRTTLKSFGSATVVKLCNGNIQVFATQLNYEIEDDFDDVPDIKTWSPDDKQELKGGVGYQITGKWSKKIGGYD